VGFVCRRLSDKATEALGRAIRPDLFVNLVDQGPEQGKDPHLMLLVLNRSPFAAEQVTATVNLGTQFEPVAPVSAPYIGPEEGRATFDLGPQLGPRVADLARAEGFLTWNHVVTVEYSDRNRSLRWRQEWIFPSSVNGSPTEPTHVMSGSGAKHPELVTAAPPPPVKPRWRDILLGRHSTR
jgi:hypothetical protein